LFLRGEPAARLAAKTRRRSLSGWEPSRGRLVIDTPYTQGAVGWGNGHPISGAQIEIHSSDRFSVVVASSASSEPIASTKRLLVSAIGRVEPTGYLWTDSWKRQVADPGGPPFLQEPVRAKVVWRHRGRVSGFVLDNEGKRKNPVKLEALSNNQGHVLTIDGSV